MQKTRVYWSRYRIGRPLVGARGTAPEQKSRLDVEPCCEVEL